MLNISWNRVWLWVPGTVFRVIRSMISCSLVFWPDLAVSSPCWRAKLRQHHVSMVSVNANRLCLPVELVWQAQPTSADSWIYPVLTDWKRPLLWQLGMCCPWTETLVHLFNPKHHNLAVKWELIYVASYQPNRSSLMVAEAKVFLPANSYLSKVSHHNISPPLFARRYSLVTAMGYLTVCQVCRAYIFNYAVPSTDFSG